MLGNDQKLIGDTRPVYKEKYSEFLLQQFPNASAAFSLRRLSGTYFGPCIRIRRDNDDAETDIFFNSVGIVNTLAIASFCGTNTAKIKIWYDQSGNSLDAVQTDNTQQAFIYNGSTFVTSNGKLALDFESGGPSNYLLGNVLNINPAISAVAVAERSSGPAYIYGNFIYSKTALAGVADRYFVCNLSTDKLWGLTNNANVSFFIKDAGEFPINTQFISGQKIISNTVCEGYLNNLLIGTDNPFTVNPTSYNFRIGASSDPSGVNVASGSEWKGLISEAIFYESDQNIPAIISAVNNFYSTF